MANTFDRIALKCPGQAQAIFERNAFTATQNRVFCLPKQGPGSLARWKLEGWAQNALRREATMRVE